jgi:hypothetical protein
VKLKVAPNINVDNIEVTLATRISDMDIYSAFLRDGTGRGLLIHLNRMPKNHNKTYDIFEERLAHVKLLGTTQEKEMTLVHRKGGNIKDEIANLIDKDLLKKKWHLNFRINPKYAKSPQVGDVDMLYPYGDDILGTYQTTLKRGFSTRSLTIHLENPNLTYEDEMRLRNLPKGEVNYETDFALFDKDLSERSFYRMVIYAYPFKKDGKADHDLGENVRVAMVQHTSGNLIEKEIKDELINLFDRNNEKGFEKFKNLLR